MAKAKEKKALEKKGWVQSFNIVGAAKVSEYTFKMNERSQKSDWVYNQMNLQIDCGEHFGKIGVELMGGYGSERTNNVVYVHGKNEDGSDNFQNTYTISWEDRLDEDILNEVGEMCFLTVGLEKDKEGKTVYNKYLTPYDAINDICDTLQDGAVVNVRGNLKYQFYNGNVTVKKEITNIALSNAKPEEYKAVFTQTVLLDDECANKDSIDISKGVLNVNAYVLEKFKEFNGHDLTQGGQIKGGIYVPLAKHFEYALNLEDKEKTAKLLNKFFKVKKGTVDQITFEGEFVESGATVLATVKDIPDEIMELVDMGMYSLEEALAKCSTNGAKERRMIFLRAQIKHEGEDDNKVATLQRKKALYSLEDIQLDCLIPVEEEEEDEELPFAVDDMEEDTTSENETDSAEEEDDLAALLNALD